MCLPIIQHLIMGFLASSPSHNSLLSDDHYTRGSSIHKNKNANTITITRLSLIEEEDDEDNYDDHEEEEVKRYENDKNEEEDDFVVDEREPPEEEENSKSSIIANLRTDCPLINSSTVRNRRREYPWTKSLPAKRLSPPRKQWMSQRDDMETIHETDSSSSDKKSVRFSTVQVREYSMTVGNHPLCRDNMPVTLDWSFVTKNVEPVISSGYCPCPDDTEYGLFDLVERSSSSYYHRPRKLTYAERKQRLVQVTGMAESQLLELYFEQKLHDQEQDRQNELHQYSLSLLPEDDVEDDYDEIILHTNRDIPRSNAIDSAKIINDSFDNEEFYDGMMSHNINTTDRIFNQLSQCSAWFEYHGGQECISTAAATTTTSTNLVTATV